MRVNDFANIVKRETRYGSPAVLTDQATLDVLAEINIRRKRIWAKWNWAWSLEPLLFAVTPGVTKYVVTAASGNLVDRITDLIPRDPTTSPPTNGAPLTQLDRQTFYSWYSSLPTDPQDIPTKYVNLGQNAAGLWQIELGPAPASAFNMAGYAKKILQSLLISDINANTQFDYFPDGVIEDVLLDGVMAGIFHIQGNDVESARLDAQFEAKLKMLVAEQNNVGRDDSGITTPPPDAQIFRQRSRSKGGTGVY